MASRDQMKGKGTRDVPVQTTKVMDSNFRPLWTEISRSLRDVDVNVSSLNRKKYGADMLSPANSKTHNIASSGSTWAPRSHPNSSARNLQSPLKTMSINNISEILCDNFRISHTIPNKIYVQKTKNRNGWMEVARGRVSKDIRKPIRGLTKLYLSNIHVMQPTLKTI